jgi:amidohydrolase
VSEPARDQALHLRRHVERATERLAAPTVELANRIYTHPELSGQELQARQWCASLLAEHGFTIEPVAGVETAFVATLVGAAPGPTVGLLAEYDALPGLGHGCGHHLIAGSAVGAGLAFAERPELIAGAVKLFGCPAEETGEGKVAMLEAGVFATTDIALTFHAHDVTSVMTRCNGVQVLRFDFLGRPSHAATDPSAGASALDGVLLTFQNINALRQFLRDGTRIHGIVTHGGDAANIIPERASCEFMVRSADPRELMRVTERVLDCARAGALASGTELSVEKGMSLDPVRFNAPLAGLVRRNLRGEGEQVEDWPALASTDFGNVSSRIPSVLFSVATWPRGTAFHTHEAAAFAGEQKAYDAMLAAARVMALSAADLFSNPELVSEAKLEHAKQS